MATYSAGFFVDATTGRPIVNATPRVRSWPDDAALTPSAPIVTGPHGGYGQFVVEGYDGIVTMSGNGAVQHLRPLEMVGQAPSLASPIPTAADLPPGPGGEPIRLTEDTLHLYVWDDVTAGWTDLGTLKGEPGAGSSDAEVAGFIDTGTAARAAVESIANAAVAPIAPDGGVRAVGKGELMVRVSDHLSSANPLLSAVTAVRSGGVVLVDVSLTRDAPWSITKPVTLRGDGGVISGSQGVGTWLTVLSADVKLDRLTISLSGTGTAINVESGHHRFALERSTITTAGATGVRLRGTQEMLIDRNAFSGCGHSVYIDGTASGDVTRNRIKNWVHRGIYVDGQTQNVGTDGLSIDWNRITDMAPGGNPRHPIQIVGQSVFHLNLSVCHNVVIGPGKSWTAADPGTADQISVHMAENFRVIGNVSRAGGDMGITVSVSCSNGVVAGNVCRDNDAAGIALGSGTATVRRIAVSGNTCMDNGRNRNNDRAATARAGIWAYGAGYCTIGMNSTGNQNGTSQQYGISVFNGISLELGPDANSGNVLGIYFNGTGNSGCRKVSTVAL